MPFDKDDRIHEYQVPLNESTMKDLKKTTGKSTIKDALTEAVKHYLECCGRKL